MRSLLEVAATGDIGELATAIYKRCANLEAKRSFHDLARPYFDTLLSKFNDGSFHFELQYGQIHFQDGTHTSGYLLTLYRGDGLVTKWALYTNLYDEINSVVEQDTDIPTTRVTRH
jgi:hypothetical protein